MQEDAQEYIGCGVGILLLAVATAIVLWAIRRFVLGC